MAKDKIRLVLNLAVWCLLTIAILTNSRNYTGTKNDGAFYCLHVTLFNLLYAAVIYTNGFLLIPRLLFRKKYLCYVAAFLLLIALSAIAFSHYIYWLTNTFEGARAIDFSFITLSVKTAGSSWLSSYLINCCIIFLLLLLFSFGLLSQRFFEEATQKETIEKKQTETELAALKSQINPHFLFNVLNSIYALSLVKSDRTPEVVLRLSEILRYMLYEARNEHVVLKKEIQMLHDYADIEKMRLNPEQILSFYCDESIPPYRIAPLLLIPFVENAIKHGANSVADAFVMIDIKMADHVLCFSCKNNYKAMPRQQDSGLGLENVRKRLQLLYPTQHTLTINNNGGIFDVLLTINLSL